MLADAATVAAMLPVLMILIGLAVMLMIALVWVNVREELRTARSKILYWLCALTALAVLEVFAATGLIWLSFLVLLAVLVIALVGGAIGAMLR